MGWSHRRTVLSEYGLMLIECRRGRCSLLRLGAPAQPLALGALAVVYATAIVAIDRRWRAREEA